MTPIPQGSSAMYMHTCPLHQDYMVRFSNITGQLASVCKWGTGITWKHKTATEVQGVAKHFITIIHEYSLWQVLWSNRYHHACCVSHMSTPSTQILKVWLWHSYSRRWRWHSDSRRWLWHRYSRRWHWHSDSRRHDDTLCTTCGSLPYRRKTFSKRSSAQKKNCPSKACTKGHGRELWQGECSPSAGDGWDRPVNCYPFHFQERTF